MKKTISRTMRKAAAAIVTIALLLTGYAAAASAAQLPAGMTQAQKDFIARVGTLASADMKRTGVLASLTIAQAILESGWGTSELARKANALFGIKADSRWSGKTYSISTKEWDGVKNITINAAFRAYGSWEQSLADHSAFLIAGARYAAVIGEGNYKKACTAIHKAGYATAPDYADKLIRLIETYGLTAFDAADSLGGTESKPAENKPTESKPGASRPPVLTAAQKRIIAAWLQRLCRR